MKKRVAIIESKSKLKEFFKKLSWWKKLVLLFIIIVVVVVVWKVFHKPYYIKDGLCYSDFLENCEGKKVEITGKIVKGQFCPKLETETYVLCDINISSCDWKTYLEPYSLKLGYEYCLALIQPCFTEDASAKINNKIERFLPNPVNKTVKMVGMVFVSEALTFASVRGVVGIVPESITITGDKN